MFSIESLLKSALVVVITVLRGFVLCTHVDNDFASVQELGLAGTYQFWRGQNS